MTQSIEYYWYNEEHRNQPLTAKAASLSLPFHTERDDTLVDRNASEEDILQPTRFTWRWRFYVSSGFLETTPYLQLLRYKASWHKAKHRYHANKYFKSKRRIPAIPLPPKGDSPLAERLWIEKFTRGKQTIRQSQIHLAIPSDRRNQFMG
jgi:hypothetical protein